ncbi:lipid-A-disaccharide synthase [Lyngbya aestuarii]|uniref:lipid-A-disaccharide synthase n=1 Tax=Lyngbya aestuarii TaxID=118322 RepID=UPI00403D63AA
MNTDEIESSDNSSRIAIAADIVILSNGPGELATWVRPVVRALRQQLGDDRSLVRISVILSPCPHATGQEVEIVKSYPEVDRVQGADYFWQFLLRGVITQNWDWREQGVVVFLGGDQFFPVVIGRRLGYHTVVYAEWEARWQGWIDRFGVMKPEIITKAPQKYRHKFTEVGDLMADTRLQGEDFSVAASNFSFCKEDQASTQQPITELIGLLPGSKSAKLIQGMPLALGIAQYIDQARPQTRFVMPVAPSLDLETLAKFADPQHNPMIPLLGGVSGQLVIPHLDTDEQPFLKTSGGVRVELITHFPAYEIISKCQLCLTTVGANTAELGSLAVPMIVLLPTQQLDAMRSWDGIPGLLANLPGFGSAFAKLINWLVLRQKRLFAWPNIWAGREIVPELVGRLEPLNVAERVIDYLTHPEKLEVMRDNLRGVRGQPGAAKKLALLVAEELNNFQD